MLCRYELPSDYNILMVQYRYGGEECVPRYFGWDNSTVLSGGCGATSACLRVCCALWWGLAPRHASVP